MLQRLVQVTGVPDGHGHDVPSLSPAQASFEVSVEARSCPGKHAQHTFTLRPVGFRDSLEVGVTYNCRCGCSVRLEPNSARCSGNGTYVCGLCECNPSYLGTRCECQEGERQSGYQNLCREAEGKPLCSGRGQCSCNQCSCFESEFGKIYGRFCECDNFSCARNKGVLCSGRLPAGPLALSQAQVPGAIGTFLEHAFYQLPWSSWVRARASLGRGASVEIPKQEEALPCDLDTERWRSLLWVIQDGPAQHF